MTFSIVNSLVTARVRLQNGADIPIELSNEVQQPILFASESLSINLPIKKKFQKCRTHSQKVKRNLEKYPLLPPCPKNVLSSALKI